MAWHIPLWNWLAHAAVGGLLVLGIGCLAASLCRQPVRRLRLIELTLLGCLLTPWLSLLTGLPQWSLGWLNTAETPAVAAMESSSPLVDHAEERERLDRAILSARATQSTDEKVVAVDPPPPSSEPAHAAPETPQLAAAPALPTPAMLVTAYAALSAGFLVWWLVGLVRLALLMRSTAPAPAHIARLFRQIAGDAGDGVRLLASAQIDLPVTFSGRRPVIVLPHSLCHGDDSAALRYCLAHEWSHIERRDIWAWHLATLAQVLFFYQPLFWWLRRQLRLCQDYLADARAAEQAAMRRSMRSILSVSRAGGWQTLCLRRLASATAVPICTGESSCC